MTLLPAKRAVLLLGFGGPSSPAEVRPFLDSVLEGVHVLPARFETVLRHYDAVGGTSPYNALAARQGTALEAWLIARGHTFPVRVAFRHSTPSFRDVFTEFAAAGVETVAGFALSPLRSQASFGKYRDHAEKAKSDAGASRVGVRYAEPFHDDPLFIAAQAERVREALAVLGAKRTFVLFSAHSIPRIMADESGYDLQFSVMAVLVAAHLGLREWGIAYQSRSGRPADPWLSPDVSEAIRALDPARFDAILVVPAGFLCENVEILYDLDVEARAVAEERRFFYARAATVLDHPSFVELMGRRVLAALESP